MVMPQVINLNRDKVVGFNGDDILDDTTQLPLGKAPYSLATIQTQWWFWDLMNNSLLGSIPYVNLTYRTDVDGWFALISEINVAALTDRTKYFVKVDCSDGSNMRSFKILEFAVENDSLEDTLMRLPYEIRCTPGNCYILWYDHIANFGNPDHVMFRAVGFQNGSSDLVATDPSKITHRGPIEAVSHP